MTMELLPGDYVVGGLAVAMAVTGLFRGFSGTLGFALAAVAAICTATFAWKFSLDFTAVTWMRAAATLVAALLAFGLVRIVTKRLVNGLLAQPTDAILGFAAGACLGASLLFGWAYSGFHLEYSNLATEVARRCAMH